MPVVPVAVRVVWSSAPLLLPWLHRFRSQELFYQQALRLFSNAFPFALEPAPSVVELALVALEDDPEKASLPSEEKQKIAAVSVMLSMFGAVHRSSRKRKPHPVLANRASPSRHWSCGLVVRQRRCWDVAFLARSTDMYHELETRRP